MTGFDKLGRLCLVSPDLFQIGGAGSQRRVRQVAWRAGGRVSTVIDLLRPIGDTAMMRARAGRCERLKSQLAPGSGVVVLLIERTRPAGRPGLAAWALAAGLGAWATALAWPARATRMQARSGVMDDVGRWVQYDDGKMTMTKLSTRRCLFNLVALV